MFDIDKIYKETSFVLYKYAKKKLLSHEKAEDLVAELFFNLIKHPEAFDNVNPENINKFLFWKLKMLLIDKKRIEQRTPTIIEFDPNLFNENEEDEYESYLLHSNILKEITEYIEQLPESKKNVIKLLYFEGLKIEEVSKRLNLNYHTTKNIRLRVIKEIQKNFSINLKNI